MMVNKQCSRSILLISEIDPTRGSFGTKLRNLHSNNNQQTSNKRQPSTTTTPPKTNIEPENEPLEEEIPTKTIWNYHFQVPG